MNRVAALRFGAFVLDLSRHALLRGPHQVPLRPQSLKVLVYLAQRSGKLATSTELIEACWENPRDTNLNSLAQCIRDIREALGVTGEPVIRTIPRKGYVFAAPVSAETTRPPDPSSGPEVYALDRSPRPPRFAALLHVRTALAGGIVIAALCALWFWTARATEPTMMAVPSIAVLPFTLVADEAGHAHAGAGLADAVTTELARLPAAYRVHIRSATGYKVPPQGHLDRAGRELGVRYVVQGTAQSDGASRSINVQLIEAHANRPVWADFFNASGDAQGAQQRMAQRIALALSSQVLAAEVRRPLPSNPEAGHFVILGIRPKAGEFGVEANRQAAVQFQKALALDPNSVPALLGYARTKVNDVLNSWTPKETWNALLDEAEKAIMLAASLEPKNAAMHVGRGGYLRARGNDAEAVAAFQHALTLYPDLPLAHAELGRAKIEIGLASETLGHIQDAMRLSPTDPLLFTWYFWAGMAETHVERYASAVEWLLKSRQASRPFDITIFYLAVAYAGLGQWEQARAYLDEFRVQRPNFSIVNLSRVFFPGRSPVVTQQRARIVALLCQLNVQGCEPTSGSKLKK